MKRPSANILLNVVVAVLYTLTGLWGLQLAFVNSNVTLLWPPSGIAMAALLYGGLSMAPGILLGALITNLLNDAAPVIATSIAAGNTMGLVIGYGLLRAAYRSAPDFGRIRFLVQFILHASLIGGLCTAIWGTLSLMIGGIIDKGNFLETFAIWWVGDAMGVLLLAPFLLTARQLLIRLKDGLRALEYGALVVLASAVSYGIFTGELGLPSHYPLIYLEFPFLVWGALRFGPGGGASLILLVAGFSSASTAAGLGPFSREDVHDSLLFLHTYLGLFATSTLMVASVFQEKRDYLIQISEARRKAEEANRLKSEFLANMSHEIRTPLTAMLGFLDLLRSDELPPEERRRYISTIQRNGEHLVSLIGDILDLSRIEAGRMTLQKRRVDLSNFLQELTEAFRVRAEQKGLSFWMNQFGSLPLFVRMDELRVRQILGNLLGNAIKFTDRGSVGLELKGKHARNDLVLIFSVVDTGPGISPSEKEKLFQPFSQLDTSSTRDYGGAGLGLAISRRLAQLIGGDVELDSSPDQGTRFVLTVPVAAQDIDWYGREDGRDRMSESVPRQEDSWKISIPPNGDGAGPPAERSRTSHASAAPAASGRRRMRVLLVEDTEDIQELIRRQLEGVPVELTMAMNGREALDAIGASRAENPFDVILMDIQMPVMDGYETVRRLRGQGYPGRILALTAHAMEGEAEKCTSAGMDGYLSKPVAKRQLLQALGLEEKKA